MLTSAKIRSADLNMAAIFNARERSMAEWRSLLREADDRFELRDVVLPPGSALANIDVRWNDGRDQETVVKAH